MSSYIIIGFPVLLVTMISMGAVFFYQRFEAVRHQQKITLKTLYVSVRELRSLGYRVDELATENRAAMHKQEKLLEHHRIMLASLGRQLGNIEAMLTQKKERSEPVRPGYKIRQKSTAPAARKLRQNPEVARSHVPVAELVTASDRGAKRGETGAVLLEKLFQQSRVTSKAASQVRQSEPEAPRPDPRLMAARAATSQSHADFEERRVSNG